MLPPLVCAPAWSFLVNVVLKIFDEMPYEEAMSSKIP